MQYEFSEDKELPPTVLREAMSAIFRAQSRFQIGELDDAAEAHVNCLCTNFTPKDSLLTCLHNTVVGASLKEEKNCIPMCFVHSVFCMQIIEYVSSFQLLI